MWIILTGAGLLILIAAVCISVQRSGKGAKRHRRCPHCGARAVVHGKMWECGFCGDSGELISPRKQ